MHLEGLRSNITKTGDSTSRVTLAALIIKTRRMKNRDLFRKAFLSSALILMALSAEAPRNAFAKDLLSENIENGASETDEREDRGAEHLTSELTRVYNSNSEDPTEIECLLSGSDQFVRVVIYWNDGLEGSMTVKMQNTDGVILGYIRQPQVDISKAFWKIELPAGALLINEGKNGLRIVDNKGLKTGVCSLR